MSLILTQVHTPSIVRLIANVRIYYLRFDLLVTLNITILLFRDFLTTIPPPQKSIRGH